MDKNNFIKLLKVDICLLGGLRHKVLKKINIKINLKNAAKVYQIAKHFIFTDLTKLSLSYIERCFTMVCKTNDFLELDYTTVKKIVASSELRVSSELEVWKAAVYYVNHNYGKRKMFLKEILLKIRLHSLSDYALKSLNKSLTLNKLSGCAGIVNDVLLNKTTNFYPNKPSNFQLSRFCSQNNFDIFVSGGYSRNTILHKIVRNEFQKVTWKHFNVVKDLSPMSSQQYNHKTVYCNGEIYKFGGSDDNDQLLYSVEKYSLTTNKWECVTEMIDCRTGFCLCAFMDKIFIIGKRKNVRFTFQLKCECIVFDTKDNKFIKAADLNEPRSAAACTVFEGRVVVSGGHNINNMFGTNTVEAYDHVAHKWKFMPNMISKRFNHSLVARKNKLFVIGDYFVKRTAYYETYDSTCKQFVILKPMSEYIKLENDRNLHAFCIGGKIIILAEGSSRILIYDIEKDGWSENRFTASKYRGYSCTLAPQL